MDHDSHPWRENHGTAILLFAGAICLFGSLILGWQQLQGPPPKYDIASNRSSTGELNSVEPNSADYEARGVRPVLLRIEGAGSDVGLVRIAVYTNADSFNQPDKAVDRDNWQIVDGHCSGIWELPLEITECAFAAYHDENENGQLDLNPIGYPVERYGFSNNARGVVGPPSYEQAKVTIGAESVADSVVIVIR